MKKTTIALLAGIGLAFAALPASAATTDNRLTQVSSSKSTLIQLAQRDDSGPTSQLKSKKKAKKKAKKSKKSKKMAE